ncbi:MAG: nucleotidyltransferase domain-containing protein [Spirochaetes bacterium]|nr:nucleotidyltransferase domain-containing protein [Spirochaetota bacterium]
MKYYKKLIEPKDLYINVILMLHMSHNNYSIKIIEALLKSENHIRGLAKILGTNQTTIARKVQELYENNIVDFKQEGKNKVVFLKKSLEAKQYAYNAETQKLLDIIKKYPNLRRIIELIKKNEKINLVILFGSYAKGIAKKDSDIDIYMDTTDNKLKEDIESIDSKISVKIGKYDKDSLLIKEIEKNHIIIKRIEIYYEKNKFFD